MEELIQEMDDMKYDIADELSRTPFFCFRARWELKAQLKILRNLIKGAHLIVKSNSYEKLL